MRPPAVDEEVLRRVERACRRYDLAVSRGIGARRADLDVRGQSDGYREAIQRVEMRALQAREILLAHDISPHMFIPYRNFTLHVDKLTRTYEAETRRWLVIQAVAHWVCYGCDQATLVEIYEQVFGLAPLLPKP